MSLESIVLPKGVGPDAEKLLQAIEQAPTAVQLTHAGGKAEGFVFGLESGKTIKSQVAEKLYIAFDQAVSLREGQLPGL